MPVTLGSYGLGHCGLVQPLLSATHWSVKPAGAHVESPPVTVTVTVVWNGLGVTEIFGVSTWVGGGAAVVVVANVG